MQREIKSHLIKSPEWISVKSKLPETNVDVLIKVKVYPLLEITTVGFRLLSTESFWGCHNFTWQDDNNSLRNSGRIFSESITHWMPLPEHNIEDFK